MANVEHSTLTTTNLHENKGVSTATNNTVATASSGATVWKLLDNTNLASAANPFGAGLLWVQQQQTSGTNSSEGNINGGSYVLRTLNTVVLNQISGSSLSSSQITLPIGTYQVYARTPFTAASNQTPNSCKSKIRNTTDGADVLIGTTVNLYVGNSEAVGLSADSIVAGQFTLSGTKTIQLMSRCNSSSIGTGQTAGFGDIEVYSQIFIWKLA